PAGRGGPCGTAGAAGTVGCSARADRRLRVLRVAPDVPPDVVVLLRAGGELAQGQTVDAADLGHAWRFVHVVLLRNGAWRPHGAGGVDSGRGAAADVCPSVGSPPRRQGSGAARTWVMLGWPPGAPVVTRATHPAPHHVPTSRRRLPAGRFGLPAASRVATLAVITGTGDDGTAMNDRRRRERAVSELLLAVRRDRATAAAAAAEPGAVGR